MNPQASWFDWRRSPGLPLGLDLLSGLEATFNWLLFSLPSGLEAMFWLSFGLLSIA
jgi:hypothetical protein